VDYSVERQLAASIGGSARQGRRELDLTQEDIAERVGLSPEFYARIERGHALPSVPTLVRIAAALCMDPDELLGRSQTLSEKDIKGHWTKKPTADSPDVRRLVRRLKQASPATLRMVSLLVRELSQKK
jgi:transcriptional regulator with XRE-family HTH domain